MAHVAPRVRRRGRSRSCSRASPRSAGGTTALTDALDPAFDFRRDTPPAKDPDTHSPKLRAFHQRLWSKPLPNGRMFMVAPEGTRRYLYHRSDLGEFFLASDSIIQSYGNWAKMAPIVDQVRSARVESTKSAGSRIGGYLVFPGNVIGGKPTINGVRGMNFRIADRFDLTLEAIRRHYVGEESPLTDVLARYADFFTLFGDFDGYVTFFLLQDLVEPSGQVRFHLPFDGFQRSALPVDRSEYLAYLGRSLRFVKARTSRIAGWLRANPERET